jgi:pre-60S factor REI1
MQLEPITEPQYLALVPEKSVESTPSLVCKTCCAEYTSKKQFALHTKKQSCTAATTASSMKVERAPTFNEMIQSAESEADIQAIIDTKIASAPRLNPETDCLFCLHKSKDLEANLEHMAASHSFFIPDIEYLADARGLIEYLGHKISVSNMCLHCNGVGKAFYSLDAVRQHMSEKGHAKIEYLENEDEYLDFYDYSNGVVDDDDDASWDNVEMESNPEGVTRRSDLAFKRYAFLF